MTKASKAKNLSDEAKKLHDEIILRVGQMCSKDIKKDLRHLNEIIAGGPQARNAQSRVRAIELKLAYAAGRPPQAVKLEGTTDNEHTITIRRDRNEKQKKTKTKKTKKLKKKKSRRRN